MTEFYKFLDATAPDVYPIRIEAGDDERFRQAVIRFAHSQGLLQKSDPVDYDLPKFAVLRWHKENGSRRAGIIRRHLYLREPEYGNSVADKLDTEDVVWNAYFKGPLCVSIKSHGQHFIAYSPASVYE